jgi:cytochrome P450
VQFNNVATAQLLHDVLFMAADGFIAARNNRRYQLIGFSAGHHFEQPEL